MIVLDTCAVLWLAFNREKFSASTLTVIDSCENAVISTMSFREIGVKLQKKKLTIPLGFRAFVHLFSGNANFTIVAPDLQIILQTLELEWEHRDPVDRIVVATAMKYDSLIVSGDGVIGGFYPRTII